MLKLNCDMGEGMAYDTEIMPLIEMASLACGEHAGDEHLMLTNIRLAKQYGVEVGAHPSYPDRENFGRISMQLEPERLRHLLHQQIRRLDRFCSSEGVRLSYVKPHGALYNDMMKEKALFETIVQTVHAYDPALRIMILSSPENNDYAQIAADYGTLLLYEIFADRNYTDEGTLVPRSQPNAVLKDVTQIVTRIEKYRQDGTLPSITGKPLELRGDSLCVHGDNEASLAVIRALRDVL